jgi:transcription antitermination factor NusG
VKSNRERITADSLKGKNLEVLLPTQCDSRGGKTSLGSPLFPGYLFCKFDVHLRLPVLTVPGVVHIVGIGNIPLPIDPIEIAGVKALVESPLQVSPFPFLPVGQKVEIQEGPLRGVEGIVLAHKGERKMVVSVTLLQRSLAVTLEPQWVSLMPADAGLMFQSVRAS